MRAAGLTLVEVLIALALMAVILVLLTNWQVSTLGLSTRTAALSRSLGELNDVSGYLGDRVRSAVRVRVATSGLSVNGAACSEASPCLAVVVPENTATGAVTRYHLYTYRLEARSRVSPLDKVEDPWAEDHVQVLREYRSTTAGPATGSTPRDCVATPAQLLASPPAVSSAPTGNPTHCHTLLNLDAATAFSGMQPYLVSDYLTPAGSLGNGATPFAHDPVGRTVTLRFQYRQRVRAQVVQTPTTPYVLTVQARNLP